MKIHRLVRVPLSTLVLTLAVAFASGFLVTAWGIFFWLRSMSPAP
jgi:hypothetical protein